jgi:small-conductance mechanosensitive channel
MFYQKNPLLEKLIRNSLVLKEKLNSNQIEKFIEESHLLPKEGQKELILKLKLEKLEQEKNNVHTLRETTNQVKDYQKKAEKIIKNYRKDV